MLDKRRGWCYYMQVACGRRQVNSKSKRNLKKLEKVLDKLKWMC